MRRALIDALESREREQEAREAMRPTLILSPGQRPPENLELMHPALIEAILAHAHSEAPREACGLLVGDVANGATYRPCRNLGSEDQFDIHPEDWVRAEDAGSILGIVHSHPGGTTNASPADRIGCDRSGLPWWIFTLDGAWSRVTPSHGRLPERV